MTIRDARIKGASLLRSHGIGTPELDAALLLSACTGLSRQNLLVHDAEEFKEETSNLYTQYLFRRISGECVAYILGHKEFFGLDFIVSPAVLVPRPDTEILVETAIDYIKELQKATNTRIRVLDLCTGSGCIGISIAHHFKNIFVEASDISKEALKIAHKNALNNSVDISFFQGDLFKPLQGLYQLIVSNPPYVQDGYSNSLSIEVQNEPHSALFGGSDGLDYIRTIIKNASDYLEQNGRILIESDSSQVGTICTLFKEYGYCQIEVYKDLSGKERVTGASHTK